MNSNSRIAHSLGWALTNIKFHNGTSQLQWQVPADSELYREASDNQEAALYFHKSWRWLHTAWKIYYPFLREAARNNNFEAVKIIECMRASLIESDLNRAYQCLVNALDYEIAHPYSRIIHSK